MTVMAPKALAIVVAYLYTGREEQAHQALQEMWPFDQEGMWKLILETRRNGILSYTKPATGPQSSGQGKNADI